MSFDPLTEQWLTLDEVCALAHLRPTQLRAAVAANRFPGPVKFGPKRHLWPRSRVQKHIARLIAESESGRARP